LLLLVYFLTPCISTTGAFFVQNLQVDACDDIVYFFESLQKRMNQLIMSWQKITLQRKTFSNKAFMHRCACWPFQDHMG